MTQVPFQVVCTSCESILEVRNPELVGQIVACPKCSSMVLLVPPQKQAPIITVNDSPEENRPAPTDDQTVKPIVESPIPEPPTLTPSADESSQDTDVVQPTLDNQATDEPLSPLAAELQAEFLADVQFDDWQKRRLIIVGVGTCCLLLTFFAFLLWMPKRESVTSGGGGPTIHGKTEIDNRQSDDNEPEVMQPSNEHPPLPPGGIEKTRTTGQPDEVSPDVAAQGTGLPLPPADQIKLAQQNGQPDHTNTVTDATDAATSNAGNTDVPPRVVRPDVVRVGSPSQGDVFIDPFGDIFDQPDNNGNAQDGHIWDDAPTNDTTAQPQNGTGTSDVDDGFAGILNGQQPEGTQTTQEPIEPGQTETNVSEIGTDSSVTRPDVHVEPGDIAGTVDSLRQEITMTVERRKIDIGERLQLPVTSMRFEKAAIIDVVRTISDLSGVPMQLDVDELRARGISVESPISLQLQETTLADVLEAVMQKTRLTRHDGDDYTVFGYTAEQVSEPRTVRYGMTQLASLAQNPISTEQAAQWLSELMGGQSQKQNPQAASVSVEGNEIVVAGTIRQQDQARRLLLSLFYMRGIEPETKMTPERLAPEVFGWDRVNAPLSFNLVEPLPLKQAARLIEHQTKMRLLIDHAALHEEGLSQETPVISHVSNGTIDAVLREMIELLGLTYRIVEANAVEITSPKIAREKMTIEAQHYAPLLTADKTPESIAETMRQVFGGHDRWNDETGGTIVIDPVSGYMLVRQSQPLQRDIRLWFGHMHAGELSDETAVDVSDNDIDEPDTGIDIEIAQ